MSGDRTIKVCQPFTDGNPLSVPAHRHINPDGTEGGWVAETAQVYGDAWVYGNAWVSGDAWVFGAARVFGDAQVSGDARVFGAARVFGDARVYGDRHLLTIGPIGSENRHLTLVRSKSGHILTIGCWQNGTVDELAAEVQRRCPDRADEYAEIEAVLRRRIAEWDAER